MILRPLTPSDEHFAAINAFIPGGYAPTGKEVGVGAPAGAPAAAGGAAAGGAAAGGVQSDREAKKKEKAAKKAGDPEKPKMSKEEKAARSAPKEKKEKKAAPVCAPYVNKTPFGEKKVLDEAMASSYDPVAVESAWYAWWEKRGFFTPNVDKAIGASDKEKFTICLPPPNVTGSLHLGHTLTGAIQDSLIRWHRMCGHETLYIPGTDHAGIATQSTVEKRLLKNEKLTRHDLGREKFLERVWDWKKQYGSKICEQLRLIASSLDWTRECFTMDETRAVAVIEGFNRFHEQGLIKRDNKLVNWCSHLRTALSDLEVDHLDVEKQTFITIPGTEHKCEVGVMCYFHYQLKGTKGTYEANPKNFITVATTRLETMLGDVAVSVHPDDPRYKHMIGKELVHPFCKDRKVVVLGDTMADMNLGTGAVKITPAHDPNDYKVGKTHGLEFITVFSEEGMINKRGGAQFEGMHRFLARKRVEEELTKLGLFQKKVKDHKLRLGICSRSGDIIEPMIKNQWWMNCDDLAKRAVDVVKSKELKLVPDFHEQTWFYWLENIRDWCISRQLWWGHRIPAWKVTEPVQRHADGEPKEVWYVARNEAEALKKAQKVHGMKVKIEQDEDVLDTWFSSGLFPFSPLQWPDTEHKDYRGFFPTSVLETGHDILFFWVARMVMMSLGLTGKLPFHTVYLHAMVRDAHGRKMSKSLGNVIEPNEVISGITLTELGKKLEEGNLPEKEVEKAKKGQAKDFPEGIPQCGADALRFGLLAYTLQGRNVNLDINRVVGYRHFCNKLWNIAKFALTNFPADYKPEGVALDLPLQWEDKWILARFNDAVSETNKAMHSYTFANATTATYNFWLYDLSNSYLEILKPRLNIPKDEEGNFTLKGQELAAAQKSREVALEVLYLCLDRGLRLLHPFLPFVTEELYQRLPNSPWKHETVMLAQYPTEVNAWVNYKVEQEMKAVVQTIEGLRSLFVSVGVHPRERPAAFIRTDAHQFLSERHDIIQVLGKVGPVKVISTSAPVPSGSVANIVSDQITVYLQVASLVDLSKEVDKQQKKLDATKKFIETYEAKSQVPNYDRVPEEVRKTNSEKLEALRKEGKEIENAIATLRAAIR